VPKLENMVNLSHKIKGIFMWTGPSMLREKKQLLSGMRGYSEVAREVFYSSQEDIIRAIFKNQKKQANKFESPEEQA